MTLVSDTDRDGPTLARVRKDARIDPSTFNVCHSGHGTSPVVQGPLSRPGPRGPLTTLVVPVSKSRRGSLGVPDSDSRTPRLSSLPVRPRPPPRRPFGPSPRGPGVGTKWVSWEEK